MTIEIKPKNALVDKPYMEYTAIQGFNVHGYSQQEIGHMSNEDFELLWKQIEKTISRGSNILAIKKQLHSTRRKLVIVRNKFKEKREAIVEIPEKAAISTLLDCFYPSRNKIGKWKKRSKRGQTVTVVDLERFSFIDNPIETMNYFERIAKAEAKTKFLTLNFLDPQIYDISPYLVLSLLRDELPKFLTKGKINPVIFEVLEKIKLSGEMKLVAPKKQEPFTINPASNAELNKAKKEAEERIPNSMNVAVFQHVTRSQIKDFTPDAQNLGTNQSTEAKAAGNLVKAIEDWLDSFSSQKQLNEEQRDAFTSVFDEVLENARRHGDPISKNGEWHMLGALQKREEDGKKIAICNVAFLNIGETYFSTLQSSPPAVRDRIDKYINAHESEVLSKELLTTIFALQDKISRITPTEENPLNGHGLIEAITSVFIESFDSSIEQHKPSFTIVSGNSWVSARYPCNQPVGNEGQRTIAFNEENDLNVSPDSKFVKTLPKKFPGTIISIRFVFEIFEKDTEKKEAV